MSYAETAKTTDEAHESLNEGQRISRLIERADRVKMLGAENASRLLELRTATDTLDKLDDHAIKVLQKAREDDTVAPLIPALRVCSDFETGGGVIFRQEGPHSEFVVATNTGILEDRLRLQYKDTPVITYVDPRYPGIFNATDFEMLMIKGLGTNNHLTVSSFTLAISEYIDDGTFAATHRYVKRYFEYH